MNSFVDAALAVLDEQAAKTEASAAELALQAARGNAPDARTLLTTVVPAGSTKEVARVELEKFDKEVARIKGRIDSIALIARRPELEAKQRELQAAMDAADAELRKAQEKYAANFTPASQGYNLVAAETGRALQLAEELARTCRNPAIVGPFREIGNKKARAQERRVYAAARIAALDGTIDAHERELALHTPYALAHGEANFAAGVYVAGTVTPHGHRETMEAQARCEAERDQLRAEVESIDALLPELAQQLNDLSKQAERSEL